MPPTGRKYPEPGEKSATAAASEPDKPGKQRLEKNYAAASF